MRTIKFRCYCKEDGKMYHFGRRWVCSEYQSLAFKILEEQVGYYCLDFDEDELTDPMQYTGLLDKNGVEIYDGDIYIWVQPLAENGKQIYKEIKVVVLPKIAELFYLENRNESRGVEVIGNIHENPELLEGKENETG